MKTSSLGVRKWWEVAPLCHLLCWQKTRRSHSPAWLSGQSRVPEAVGDPVLRGAKNPNTLQTRHPVSPGSLSVVKVAEEDLFFAGKEEKRYNVNKQMGTEGEINVAPSCQDSGDDMPLAQPPMEKCPK